MSSVSEIRLINADSLCWKIIPDPRVASKNRSESGTVAQMAKDAFNSYMAVTSWAAHAIQALTATHLAARRELPSVRAERCHGDVLQKRRAVSRRHSIPCRPRNPASCQEDLRQCRLCQGPCAPQVSVAAVQGQRSRGRRLHGRAPVPVRAPWPAWLPEPTEAPKAHRSNRPNRSRLATAEFDPDETSGEG